MISNNVIIPQFRDELNDNFDLSKLPIIRGSWYWVDPYAGSDSSDGSNFENALANIAEAYDRCVSGRGDGIILLSGGTTSANTTSYLKQELLWTKHGITVIGVSAPTGIFGRARIASVDVTTGPLTDLSFTNSGTADYISRVTGSFITDGFVAGQKINVDTTSNTNDGNYTILTVEALKITLSTGDSLTTEDAATAGSTTIKSYNVQNITISGSNNSFVNVSIWNGGALSTALGGIKITGARNYFAKCHIVGGAGCTATANERSIELGDGAQENIFENCTIGTDTVDRGNNANCELLIAGTVTNTARNFFKDCTFLAQANTGTVHVAVKWASATCMGRHMIFDSCKFMCYVLNKGTWQASVFGGTTPTTAETLICGGSATLGYLVWDSTSATTVFIATPVGSATGGVALVG
jgi:hypothetical protein